MSYDAWPSPEARRGPLPRIEDLPVTEQGYDQEAVRRAFDDFYRHAAQLDASLKALEAVDGFQRTAAQLRNDLRALRALDLGGSGPAWTAGPYAWDEVRPQPELPTAALRIGGEAAVIVAVGVIAGVTHLRAWTIVALMGAALFVAWLSEWFAARARTRVPRAVHDPLYEPVAYGDGAAPEPADPAPYVETPALESGVGWSAFEHPPDDDEHGALDEDDRDGASRNELTMVEQPLEDTEEHAAPFPDDGGLVDERQDAAEDTTPEEPHSEQAQPEDEPQPPIEPRRGWFRRRGRRKFEQETEQRSPQEPGPAPAPASEGSGHVRVLAAGDVHEESWERGFDGE